MLTNINPRDRNGRLRFGSSIFIKRDTEKLLDVIKGERRFSHIIILGILVFILQFIAVNIPNLLSSICLYYLLYTFSTQDIIISSTKSRFLTRSSFRYPRMIKTLSTIILVWTFLSMIEYFTGSYVFSLAKNYEYINSVFQLLSILPIFVFQYFQVSLAYNTAMREISTFVMIITNVSLVSQFYFINYQFSEVNHNQISDYMVRMVNKTSMSRLVVLHFIDLFLLVVVFQRLSLAYLIIISLLHLIIPKKQYSELNYFGSSGRKVFPSFIVSSEDNHSISRITRELFSIPDIETRDDAFPIDIIPRQVASYYETGLRASLKNALNQGNIIGLVIASIINTFVIISLFRFSLTQNRDTLPEVIGITLGIVAGVAGSWVVLKLISRIIFRVQKAEYLMIGNNFIGRWAENGLWFLRGEKLEGRRKSRSNFQKLLNYDRISGMHVAWITLSLIILFAILLLLISFWVLVGALNLANVIFIFPFLFNIGITFLSIKANAELSFFIFSSFVIWILIFNFYPRLYKLYRPKLIIDPEHLSTISVILKDESTLHDAISDFTKCIIQSARSSRRPSLGRPGYFELSISFISCLGNEEDEVLQLVIGENEKKSKVYHMNDLQIEQEIVIFPHLLTNAMKGYPVINITILQGNDRDNLSETLQEEIHLDTGKERELTLTTISGVQVSLKFNITRAVS